jgi:hypothetical protein
MRKKENEKERKLERNEMRKKGNEKERKREKRDEKI